MKLRLALFALLLPTVVLANPPKDFFNNIGGAFNWKKTNANFFGGPNAVNWFSAGNDYLSGDYYSGYVMGGADDVGSGLQDFGSDITGLF